MVRQPRGFVLPTCATVTFREVTKSSARGVLRTQVVRRLLRVCPQTLPKVSGLARDTSLVALMRPPGFKLAKHTLAKTQTTHTKHGSFMPCSRTHRARPPTYPPSLCTTRCSAICPCADQLLAPVSLGTHIQQQTAARRALKDADRFQTHLHC